MTFSGGTTTTTPASSSTSKYNGNLFGADIQFGYKQFFGAKKRFGLRYYGLFSGQGGEGTFLPQGSPKGDYVHQQAANLFYGVGLDALYNFYESNGYTYGIFGGVMIGGSSWLMGKGTQDGSCYWTSGTGACESMNENFKQTANSLNGVQLPGSGAITDTFLPTYVQFIVNIGFRANFSKHQGFELGVRIPTIDDPYSTFTQKSQTSPSSICGYSGCTTYTTTTGSSKTTLTFRRNIAIYANYVYNF